MSTRWQWLAAAVTVAALAAYELWLAVGRRQAHQGVARAAHAALREQWAALLTVSVLQAFDRARVDGTA